MSSLIEQAAHRLEQLRAAGVVIPEPVTAHSATPAAAGGAAVPSAAALREAHSVAASPQGEPAPPAAGAPAMATRATDSTGAVPLLQQKAPQPLAAEAGSSSRRVELDLQALATTGVVTPNAPRSHIADQYRVIKRPLISNAMGKGAAPLKRGNLIMVTSALAGEGKSFTSINLAMSIATELDNTVMLVDADVARPSVLRMLSMPPGPGLLDLLEGRTDMSSVLLKTNIDKLTILPSGTPHPRATELLASEAMRHLLDDMANRYPDRIIIFDSPPLLLTTESRVLATHMGQIVLVVQADKTLQADVQHALSTIENCPVRLLLLNQARPDSRGAYGYGYGSRYGYGYGYGHQGEKASA